MSGVVYQPFLASLGGGAGVTDHPALTGLTWALSGHTGAPARLAGFSNGGNATDINEGDGIDINLGTITNTKPGNPTAAGWDNFPQSGLLDGVGTVVAAQFTRNTSDLTVDPSGIYTVVTPGDYRFSGTLEVNPGVGTSDIQVTVMTPGGLVQGSVFFDGVDPGDNAQMSAEGYLPGLGVGDTFWLEVTTHGGAGSIAHRTFFAERLN